MQAQFSSLAVAGVGTYSQEGDGRRPIAHGDGSLVRYVELAGTDGGLLKVPVAQACELEHVERGDLVDVVMDVRDQPGVAYTRDGREYVKSTVKLRVLAVELATVAS